MPEVIQRDNIIGRDMAARDIIYNLNPSTITHIRSLINKFNDERKNDVVFKGTLDILKHYIESPKGLEVIGLEEKLKKGDRLFLYNFAQSSKQSFSKKLVQYQFSEAAQEMHACLLAEVYTRFHQLVLPVIQRGTSIEEVNRIVQRDVIEPIQSLLEDNVLGHLSTEVNGMLYFLTGNCHINWDGSSC
jgi:hypothetical protein